MEKVNEVDLVRHKLGNRIGNNNKKRYHIEIQTVALFSWQVEDVT